ncbi:MAG TPA: DUF4224 domain-containing protein [Cellvibrio sp.]|nr:DUF4224 domain-containing protein [Cellvibrio sp.]
MQVLSKEDLIELTGYKRPKDQIKHLSHHGINFGVDKFQRPKVLLSHIEERLGSKKPSHKKQRSPELNLDLI